MLGLHERYRRSIMADVRFLLFPCFDIRLVPLSACLEFHTYMVGYV